MTGDSHVPQDAGYPEPGGRAPAPAPLRLAQVFVNTADLEAGADALADPGQLTAWLRHFELLDDTAVEASENDLALALDLREGLRALFLSHHEVPVATHARDRPGLERLEQALTRLPLRATARTGSLDLLPAGSTGARAGLTRIAAVLARAEPGELTRLKACRRDECRWVFYDSSRNHRSSWCAMDICGARTKMRTYRARQRPD